MVERAELRSSIRWTLEWSWKCELDCPDLTGGLKGGLDSQPVDPIKKTGCKSLGLAKHRCQTRTLVN